MLGIIWSTILILLCTKGFFFSIRTCKRIHKRSHIVLWQHCIAYPVLVQNFIIRYDFLDILFFSTNANETVISAYGFNLWRDMKSSVTRLNQIRVIAIATWIMNNMHTWSGIQTPGVAKDSSKSEPQASITFRDSYKIRETWSLF